MSASSMHDPSPREPPRAEPRPPAAAGSAGAGEASAGEASAEAADLLRSFRDSLRNAGAGAQREAPRPERGAPATGAWTGASDSGAWTAPPTGGPDPSAIGAGAGALAELVDLALRLLEALWRLMPPELRHHWQAIQREVLLAVRALIDHHLERLDAESGPKPVEDIPIE